MNTGKDVQMNSIVMSVYLVTLSCQHDNLFSEKLLERNNYDKSYPIITKKVLFMNLR